MTLVLYLTDRDANDLQSVRYFPAGLPRVSVYQVGDIDIQPCDEPFGFESWMDGGGDSGRAQAWFDTAEEMEKSARDAVRSGKCVKYLPRREVAADAACLA